ncbi:MAG TPA: hypothetical protein DCY51_07930 [Bacteroidetes bacterium]|nr:hypothetical protein [Bacteroidota bacterium]
MGSVYFYLKIKAKPRTTPEMNSLVVVEALKRVFKVVTAEGHFTEIVDYRETKHRLSVWPSTKKALIKVKAHVQMGYDFSKIKWEIYETNGKVKLQAIPAPYILSISPDINYYNLANGLFNKFTNEDFNLIQTQCIATVREVAEKSELPHLAAEQAKMLLTELASMHHWEIEGVKLLDS